MNSSPTRPANLGQTPAQGWAFLHLCVGVLLVMGSLLQSACSPAKSQNSNAKRGLSKDEIEAGLQKISSIAAMNPERWIAKANHFQDSVVMPVSTAKFPITETDRKRLDQALESGKISLSDARRIFQEPRLELPEPAATDANAIGLQVWSVGGVGETPALEMIQLDSRIGYGDADLYFVQGNTLYGKVRIYHHYGLEAEGFEVGNAMAMVGARHCLESGTGIWHFVNAFYTISDDRLQAALVYPQACNSNMMPEARNWHLESEMLSKNPLQVRFKWEITLGHRNEEGRYFAKDSTVIGFVPAGGRWQPDFGNGRLSMEKMAAFSVFSSDSLFVHAWSKELAAALKGKNKAQKRMVLDLLAEMHDFED